MQVILTQSVTGVGKAGEAHKVADGYARNYLIPRKLAVEATKGNLRNLEKIQEDSLKREAAARSAAEKVLAAIDGVRLNMPARVSADGSKLYGSVTTQDIANALKSVTGQELDKRLVLTDAIKRVSIQEVPIRVYAGITARVTVAVYPEGQQPPPIVVAAPPEPEVVEAPAPEPVAEPAPEAEAE
ncbi:MAG TPA: 50S ribosomal protein L9 [Armatimonadota bacterium]|jgi:large subunit ribosomal protein L9